jgi:MFS family permease
VGLSDADFGKGVAISYIISFVMAYPLGVAADRFHPLRVGLITIVVYLGVSALGFFIATTPTSFMLIFILHTCLGGVFATGTASIVQRMLPADKFAQFFSAANLIRSVAFMIVPPTLGCAVEELGHNYRYAFGFGFGLTAAALGAFALLLQQYRRLGGDKAFVPPGTQRSIP